MATKAQIIHALRHGDKPGENIVKGLLANCPDADLPTVLHALYELNIAIPSHHQVKEWQEQRDGFELLVCLARELQDRRPL